MVLRPDVVIIGAGMTGLLLAKKLADLGFAVLLLERESTVASGPSIRNEGWLHRGTYHAFSIRDEGIAIQVARRCIYGHEQIRSLVPEAIESAGTSSFALLRDSDLRGQLLERWNAAGVLYREVSRRLLQQLEPDILIPETASVYEVQDVSIDTRVVYRKLLHQSMLANARILRDVNIVGGSRTHLEITAPEHMVIEPRIFVYTAGFSNAALFKSLHDISLPLRFWKSHLVVLPRVGQNAVFYLDPLEAAMMHHGRVSIAGLNEDARECSEPSYETDPDCVEAVWQALARLVKRKPEGPSLSIACTKVDVLPGNVQTIARRSLETFYREDIPGHIWVLPGKMTEAPFVVDQVVREICGQYPDPRVSQRPCDTLSHSTFVAS